MTLDAQVPDLTSLEPVATFCGNCDCGCPQLFVDPSASEDRRIVLTDDFGQCVQMSATQFADLVTEAKAEQAGRGDSRLKTDAGTGRPRDPAVFVPLGAANGGQHGSQVPGRRRRGPQRHLCVSDV